MWSGAERGALPLLQAEQRGGGGAGEEGGSLGGSHSDLATLKLAIMQHASPHGRLI